LQDDGYWQPTETGEWVHTTYGRREAFFDGEVGYE